MSRYFILLSVFYSLALMAFGQSKSTKPITLFTVGGSPVNTDEFIYLFKKNHAGKPDDFTKEKIDDYLNLFINFKLKVREAQAQGLDTAKKFRGELAGYRDELKKPYRANKDLVDNLAKEAYAHLLKEIKASHILIQLKPDASAEDTLKAYTKISEIRKRILAGEDFEKLARELSEDPSAKYNGGSLSYFTALQMVYPFEEMAYKTEVGHLSPVVRTRFGYHLIKVEDVRPSRGEVEVSHILLRAPKDDQKAKNQIFEIDDQLKRGRHWDELCKQYSEDTNTKNSGGRLKPFGTGVFVSVPEFEAAAFALQKPGDVSDPFQSNIGWHIIRLEKKIPLAPYAEMEAALKKKIVRDERMKIAEAEEAAQRKKSFAFQENEATKKIVFALADSSLQKGKWRIAGHADTKALTLFSLQGRAISSGEFINWAELNQRPNKLPSGEYLHQLYTSFVSEKENQAEEEKIIRENPDFLHLLTEYREGILLFDVMEKEVWNNASADTLGQKKFYQDHLSQYQAGPRVEARVISTTDQTFFEELKKKIHLGDTLTRADIKKFKSIQNFRAYEKGDSKVIDKINWVPGIQETELDLVYYFVEVRRLVAPGMKSFDEARARIISDYQDSLEKNWISSLRQKFPVSINTKGKKFVETNLQKK
ncbi:MAG: peptidylprolyl isomerase [Bacteroidetes bacterium]|nr:peptidylprolyl isomerase [Bacteroidota bacterium]MBS1539113.1 peptidylprolyl isomerase [Bacteroidota bacterium]